MLTAGQRVELTIEKPAAGGRMIGRHQGQVLLVAGSVPGERVSARIERVERSLAFAETVDVLEPSPDRRDPRSDPLCGGCLYAHVAYPRQLQLKSEVIADAFARIGHITLAGPVEVAASAERGYRMRARLHVKNGQVGFYREGTHELCDAAQTGQLSEPAIEAAARAAAVLRASGQRAVSIEIAENLAADQRALHLDLASAQGTSALFEAMTSEGVTGCSAQDSEGRFWSAGAPAVADPLEALTGGRARGSLQRHVRSFFQANRHLLPALVTAVIDAVPPDGEVLDLYAGVGVFSVSLGGTGRKGITAVEGDASSGNDLTANVGQLEGRVRAVVDSVEAFLARSPRSPATLVADPPRTGISRTAMSALIRLAAPRVVYVSCDPPTMARDAAKLIAGGYRITSLSAFDLFPNTPHVECLAVLDH